MRLSKAFAREALFWNVLGMSLTPEEQAGLANIQAFVTQMLHVTVRLVRLDERNKPDGVSSGFIIERDGSWYLLAAYHSLKRGRYCLETDVDHEGDALLLTFDSYSFYRRFEVGLGEQNFDLSKGEEIDFGWMKIDREKLAKMFASEKRLHGKSVELPLYVGPVNQRPRADDFYGYAAWNRVKLEESCRTFLWRDYSCEVGLRFLGTDPVRKLYRFRPYESHKGDDYYRGASGAPIADSSGLIVSMLISGSEEDNLLYGLPLADVEPLIGLDPSILPRTNASG